MAIAGGRLLRAGQHAEDRVNTMRLAPAKQRETALPAGHEQTPAGTLPHGQAKKQVTTLPPGQANKPANGGHLPGHAEQHTATGGGVPPGQAKRTTATVAPDPASAPTLVIPARGKSSRRPEHYRRGSARPYEEGGSGGGRQLARNVVPLASRRSSSAGYAGRMRGLSGVSNLVAIYVLLPAVGVACGFGMLAARTSLGALWLVIGPLAGAAVSGWLARKSGRDALPTLFVALSIATLILVASLFGLLVFALGQLPDGFEGS